jgi:hypothetical protein
VDLFVLTASTVDDVAVTGSDSRVDDGIKTREGSAREAWHAPESVGGAGQQGHGRREGCDGLHRSGRSCVCGVLFVCVGMSSIVALVDGECYLAARTFVASPYTQERSVSVVNDGVDERTWAG